MGFLFLYLLVSVCCFMLIRYANSLDPNPKEMIPVGLGIFVSLIPLANLLTIFTLTGYIIFIKYIKPNPSIFSDRWKSLNNWFTHGKL